MDIIKEIINCETNKKFVRVHDDGFIDIPDVIFYVLYESGETDVVGCILGDVYPQIAEELDDWIKDSHPLGFLCLESLKEYFNSIEYLYKDVTERTRVVKAFVEKAKKLLPYLDIDKSVDEWMKEH